MGQTGLAGRPEHYTPGTDEDFLLWRSFLDREDFNSASRLCRERKMQARDASACVRWAKDAAIVEAMQGRFLSAYDMLADVHFVAESLRGRARGKYENELGLVLVERGYADDALPHFGEAYNQHLTAGSLRGCAAVEHNTGRAYAARGDHAKAADYFKRALDFARATDDYRLEREVIDSILEFEVGSAERR